VRRGGLVALVTAAAAAVVGLVKRRRPTAPTAPASAVATLARSELDRLRARLPLHHDPNGGFRNPWPTAFVRDGGGFLRWQRERRAKNLPPNPGPEALPLADPDVAYPHAPPDEVRITWVGHATFLVQIGGVNILTDPHWSRRASPVQFAGPLRFVPPGLPWEELPRIDAVLVSHSHYDHLDSGTVRRLRRRFGDEVRWFTPLAYRDWFAARGVRNVTEFDWWETARLDGPAGPLQITALPCQHWSSRTLWDRRRRLWASWSVAAPNGRSVYFGGDSGYFPGYPEIGERAGPFDAVLMPIGAYEPRWFMRPMHMNPEEAVRAYVDLGATGTLLGMHWGTWRLTDEDPLEPPERMQEAWANLALPPEKLQLLRHGGTWRLA
jgi:N-acyl-phosphatidylethanolamine-hydrolysing phospholipase D